MKKVFLMILAVALVALMASAAVKTSAPSSQRLAFQPFSLGPFVFCGPGCGGGGDGVHCDNNYSPSENLYRNYSGYVKNTVNNGTITANIEMASSHITSTGVASAAWTGIHSNTTPDHWIQAGVSYTNGGLRRYVEWNDGSEHYLDVGSASLGVSYSVTVARVSTNVWEGSVGGSAWITSGTLTGLSQVQTATESQDESPLVSCNALDAVFTSMNPARNTMSNGTEAPDFVENVGSASFEGVQMQQGS